MGKAVNKFKTAEFLAQQALKTAKAASQQSKRSAAQPLADTIQPLATVSTVDEAAGKAHPAKVTSQTATNVNRHASVLLNSQSESKTGKRRLATSAADGEDPTKSVQPVAKKPKVIKAVPVATIFAAPQLQGMHKVTLHAR